MFDKSKVIERSNEIEEKADKVGEKASSVAMAIAVFFKTVSQVLLIMGFLYAAIVLCSFLVANSIYNVGVAADTYESILYMSVSIVLSSAIMSVCIFLISKIWHLLDYVFDKLRGIFDGRKHD